LKNIWISDLDTMGPVEGVFLISECSVGTARDDAAFLRMKLQDKTGMIEGVKWSASARDQQVAKAPAHVQIRGRLDMYNGNPQIKIDRISVPTEPCNPEDFLPLCARDRVEMQAELEQVVTTIKHPQVRELLQQLCGNTDLNAKFTMAPAATTYHHAYLGGLLEHTLSVVRIAEFLCQHYPELNRDLMLAGVILHDVGKTEELDWDVCLRYNDQGQMLGHITQGAMLVNKLIDAIPGFEPLWRTMITHIILSHHGKLEFGSPKLPMFREAVMVNYIEDLDSKMQVMSKELNDRLSSGSSDNWTKKVFAMDGRYLFKGVPLSDGAIAMEDFPDAEGDTPPVKAKEIGGLFGDVEDPFDD